LIQKYILHAYTLGSAAAKTAPDLQVVFLLDFDWWIGNEMLC
jgi:hypothetical protein